MLEPAVIVLRLLQYLGAMVLFGSSLFFLYALPRHNAPPNGALPFVKPLLASAALLLAVASALGLLAQTSVLAGSIAEGLKPDALKAVITGMDLGKAAVARTLAAAVAAGLILTLPPGRRSLALAAAFGAVATASLAWSGHAAATEGAAKAVHLLSDMVHGLAAAAWIGALFGFCLLQRWSTQRSDAAPAFHAALQGFAGLGSLLVAVLIATGLINSWFLVTPDRISGLWTTTYGRLLVLKLVLFGGMLALAAANRFRLTPALRHGIGTPSAQAAALSALRRSLYLETSLSVAVLALVAWFGTLAPPAAL